MGKFLKGLAFSGAIAATGAVVYRLLDERQQREIQAQVGKLNDEAKERLVDAQYAVNDLLAKAGLDEQAADLAQKATAAGQQVQARSNQLWQTAQAKVESARDNAQVKKDAAQDDIVLNLDNLDDLEADAKANETVLKELDQTSADAVADQVATIEAQTEAIVDQEAGLATSGKQKLSDATQNGLAASDKTGLADSTK